MEWSQDTSPLTGDLWRCARRLAAAASLTVVVVALLAAGGCAAAPRAVAGDLRTSQRASLALTEPRLSRALARVGLPPRSDGAWYASRLDGGPTVDVGVETGRASHLHVRIYGETGGTSYGARSSYGRPTSAGRVRDVYRRRVIEEQIISRFD